MLPVDIDVRLASEMGEWAATTPVRRERMPLPQLIERMLGLTGKDPGRIAELLLRGSLLSGGVRHRWQGLEVSAGEISRILASFPDDDPSRVFIRERCDRVVLHGGADRLALDRESASKRRLFRGDDFWSVLMRAAASPVYRNYAYRERADVFRAPLSSLDVDAIRAGAGLLAFSSWERQVKSMRLEALDLFVVR